MALNLDVVGQKPPPLTHRYDWKDTVLYALGIGAKLDELDFLFEMNGPKVLPTFGVIAAFPAMSRAVSAVGANPAMVVHGEQKIVLYRTIPPGGALTTLAEITGIYDKGKGAVVAVETKTFDEESEPIFDNDFSIFVRGAGGYGGPRGPEGAKIEPPARAPDFTVSERTLPEQAALYRLSGDPNPLHISPQFAKMAGFDRPILHGLCTYGFAGRALLRHACGGDPARLKSFAARFAGVVFPGDTLTTEGWQLAPGTWAVRTRTQDDRVVLANSVAETA
jgi:acyl dehydratase